MKAKNNNSESRKNILTGYIAKIWGLIGNFVFVPVYILIYGESNYGLIALSVTISLTLLIFDAGITPALTRYFAELSSIENAQKIYNKLLTYCIVLIALTATLTIIFYEKIMSLSNWEVSCGTLMAIGIGGVFNLFNSMFRSLYYGLNLHARFNLSNIVYNVLRSVVPCGLGLVDNSIAVFFYTQLLVSIIFLVYQYKDSYKVIKSIEETTLDNRNLVNSDFAAFFYQSFVISILSTYLNQIDRYVFTVNFNSIEFGQYINIMMLASIPTILTMPLITVVYTHIIKAGAADSYWSDSIESNALLINIFNPFIAMFLYGWLPELYEIWKGLPFPSQFEELYKYSVVIFFLNTMQMVPYHIMLAHGKLHIFSSILALASPVFAYFYLYYAGTLGIDGWLFPSLVLNIILTGYLYYNFKLLSRKGFESQSKVVLIGLIIVCTYLMITHFT